MNTPNPDTGAGVRWRKAGHAIGDCVEVAAFPDGTIGVRDSDDPDGAVLRFRLRVWDAFLNGVRHGEFTF